MVNDKKYVPGVGKYELEVDQTEKIIKKYKYLGDLARKEAPIFKVTCFDDQKVDLIKVGPGGYDPYKVWLSLCSPSARRKISECPKMSEG
jgi:hypothetical protein